MVLRFLFAVALSIATYFLAHLLLNEIVSFALAMVVFFIVLISGPQSAEPL